MTTRLVISFILILLSTSLPFGQDVLDTSKYKDAELFVIKKGYDVQQRLQEIRSIEGKEVTVFEVSGKQNKIKRTYTGIAEMSNVQNFSDKQKATLITVKIMENGKPKAAYFPLTNSSNYRIYLTEKMK